MMYRRFGRTELQMPVFSCGGMRYQHGWGEASPDSIPAENQKNLEVTIHRAVEAGINHIETARGYGTSELQLGRVLPSLPRDRIIVQTKIAPADSAAKFLETFELSMRNLCLDHLDLLGIHGINTPEILEKTLRHGGALDAAKQLRREGRIRHIGFSTHAPCETIVEAVRTGEFDYINLHWYFVNDANWPAVEAATQQDMGVFIISPNDKGGKLYEPPPKLRELCAPLTPMMFNDLYCLARPQVHTLSIGAARPTDFDEHLATLEFLPSAREVVAPVEARLRAELERVHGRDWMERGWQELPDPARVPGNVNLREIVRLWTLATGLDLVEFGKMRYNLLGNGGHWFPGENVEKLDFAALPVALGEYPFADRLPDILREAHGLLGGEEVKRLSSSD